MAWSWSHTAEGIQAVMDNIADQSEDWLETVYAEWRAAKKDPHHCGWDSVAFNERRYERALKWAKQHHDFLVEPIQTWTEELSTCTNGGHEAWCCPYGCHTVPFDREAEDAKEQADYDAWLDADEGWDDDDPNWDDEEE